jgi:hypothetical protein
MNEAEQAIKAGSRKYSPTNLSRMVEGKAPLMRVVVTNRKTGATITREMAIELHHLSLPQRGGAAARNDGWNLVPVNRWSHEAMDEFRHAGWDLVSILNGPNSF